MPGRCRHGPITASRRNPAAWITQVAKNLALDLIRREKIFHNKQIEIARLIEQDSANATAENTLFGEKEITDDRLRMMFVCCHPVLPQEAHVALALKTLCGFSAGEIARAFLTSEAAIAKATDAGQAKNPRRARAVRDSGGRGAGAAPGRRAANALSAFQRRLQSFSRRATDQRRALS